MYRLRPAVSSLILVATILAGCGGSSPSGPPASTAPVTSGAPSGAASGGPSASGGATASGAPATGGTTSAEKITTAYEAGQIDRPTALLYRLQASLGDDRLPAEYSTGTPAEDGAAAAIALSEWSTFTDAQRAAMLPYLVRPTDGQSVWKAATASTGDVVLAANQSTACENGFMRQQLGDLPVVVWGQCGFDNAAIASKMADTAAILAQVWDSMTAVMGEPLGDQNVAGDNYPDSPEAGDGMLDIYVVASSLSAHGRGVANAIDALAITDGAAPFEGTPGAERSSSFIVVDGTRDGGAMFKSVIVHEFFHSLEFAHNNRGMLVLSAAGTGAPRAWEYHWFVEASATWAEHHWVPEARTLMGYPRFSDKFQATGQSLTSVAAGNEYASWVWAYFVEQEQDEYAIGDIWTGFEGREGFDELQNAMESVLSFTSRFRDFAVRAYNTKLEPGNPITPHFQALDPSFPETAPHGVRLEDPIDVAVGPWLATVAVLPGLWAQYYELDPAAEAKKIEFDFSGMAPRDMLDVDLLIKTKDGWTRRPGGDEPVCNAEEIIVVLANHAITRGAPLKGAWKVKGGSEPCNDGNWFVTLTGAKAGAGTYSGRSDYIRCSTDSAGHWSMLFGTDMKGDIYTGQASTDPQSISVNTRFAMDDPLDWDWQKSFPRPGSVAIRGDTSKEPWTVHVDASWDESNDPAHPVILKVTMDVVCNDVYMGQ